MTSTRSPRRHSSRSRVRRLVGLLGLVSIVLGATLALNVGTSSANATLDGMSELACNSPETYGNDAGDLALAVVLKLDGYACTKLLSKGQLEQNTFTQVGELWRKKVDSVLQIRIIIFGASNTDLSNDAKACLDDDTNPINNVQPGDAGPSYCLGSDGATSIAQGADNGPTYGASPLAPVASAGEETAGAFELRIDLLPSGTYDPDSAGPAAAAGGWNVNIDGYTEIVLHFNQGQNSIVSYFQPATTTTTTTSSTSTSSTSTSSTSTSSTSTSTTTSTTTTSTTSTTVPGGNPPPPSTNETTTTTTTEAPPENAVLGAIEEQTTTTTSTTAPPEVQAVVAAAQELPFTGSSTTSKTALAIGLIVFGGVLVIASGGRRART